MTSYLIECWLNGLRWQEPANAPCRRVLGLIRYRAAPSWAAEREAILREIRAKLRETVDAV